MFGSTYFSPAYFGPTYYGRASTPTPTPTPTGTLFLTGPLGGTTGAPSSNFTVTQSALGGSDTITPHTDSTGTFFPTTLAMGPSSSAKTFRYTAAIDGPHAITITDTLGATILGSPISYTSATPTPTPTPTEELKVALLAALEADPAAAALFGDRIYPVIIPQSSPQGAATLTYQFEQSQHDTTLTAPAGIRYVSILFRVSSFDHADIESGREVIRNFFQGFRGELDGLPIIYIYFDTENDGYDEPISGNDIGTYWKELPFTFKLRESMPTNVA